MYKRLLRPLLFSMDEEQSHALSEYALHVPLLWNAIGAQSQVGNPALATTIAGVGLPSPVGLAAGYDKNCRVLRSLINLGFGFVTGGTVTLAERTGNPPKRMVRLPASEALLNSLGFPGEGLARVSSPSSTTGQPTIEDIRQHLGLDRRRDRGVLPADSHRWSPAVELNISSPNTVGLRVFHDPARLRTLIELLRSSRPASTPLLVKLPPWSSEQDERRSALAIAETAVNAGADGLVIANTVPVEDGRLAVGKGGLSGAPLLENTERMTAEVAALVGKNCKRRIVRRNLATRTRLANVRRGRVGGTALHRYWSTKDRAITKSTESRFAGTHGHRRDKVSVRHLGAATVLIHHAGVSAVHQSQHFMPVRHRRLSARTRHTQRAGCHR